MSTLPEFKTVNNIRDLGGMKTRDGRKIKPGRLIRSGNLARLSDEEQQKLFSFVGTVVDFRSGIEREEKPDVILPGVRYETLPLLDKAAEGISHEEETDRKTFRERLFNADAAKEQMCRMYRKLARNEYSVRIYSRFLQILLDQEEEKAVLWHCTVGMDRAGCAAVILETILGISEDDITEDYLITSRYIEPVLRPQKKMIKEKFGVTDDSVDEALNYLLDADPSDLESFRLAVNEAYGSFDVYVRSGLKLSDQETEALRKKYLMPAER